jgi:hypothetical protein
MCMYCSVVFDDGWGQLLEYDELYQSTLEQPTAESTYGFQAEWDDLRDELGI